MTNIVHNLVFTLTRDVRSTENDHDIGPIGVLVHLFVYKVGKCGGKTLHEFSTWSDAVTVESIRFG